MLLIGQIYLESPQQTGNVDWLEHSMHINTTAIRGQIGQVQALKPARAGTVLVQEIRYFLWEVAENLQASKAHLSCAHHILPHQGPPANVVITTASKLVRNFTPPHGPSPDVAPDAQTSRNVHTLVQSPCHAPPPIRT